MTKLSLEGFRTRGRDSTVRQGVPFLDRSRIERILTSCGLACKEFSFPTVSKDYWRHRA